MIDDASDLVTVEGVTKTVTRRTANVLRSDGIEVPGDDSTFETKMVVWPASGRERQLLPEGQRSRNAVGFVSIARLYAVRDKDRLPADRFDHDGTTFEVTRDDAWGHLVNVYSGLAIEVES